jgi:hypothetical protein
MKPLVALFATWALAACAADVDSTPMGVSQQELSNASGDIPKCKEDEVLCCPNGGPNCSCLPAGHTCSGGFVVSPTLKRAP